MKSLTHDVFLITYVAAKTTTCYDVTSYQFHAMFVRNVCLNLFCWTQQHRWFIHE